jgi:hypothetical protein
LVKKNLSVATFLPYSTTKTVAVEFGSTNPDP